MQSPPTNQRQALPHKITSAVQQAAWPRDRDPFTGREGRILAGAVSIDNNEVWTIEGENYT